MINLCYGFVRAYLLTFLVLQACLVFGQSSSAGPDQFICSGGVAQIGAGTLCSGCCVKWRRINSNGFSSISNPDSLNTTVAQAGSYVLTTTYPNGTLIYDTVVVGLSKIFIKIFDPKVVTGSIVQVPDSIIETIGAQTFVNYDSDDNDKIFDIDDTDVAGGDDEVIKIRIELFPDSASSVPLPTAPVMKLNEMVTDTSGLG